MKLIDEHLSLSDSDVAKALGYSDPSTLWKIRQGIAFVDVERLAALAKLGQRSLRPNLHWLICGEGPPLLDSVSRATDESELRASLGRLSAQEKRAVLTLIGMKSGKKPRR